MSEKVTFTALKSDRENSGKRYVNFIADDGRELTASYPVDPRERKPYHATPEWVDGLIVAFNNGTPVEVEIRDNKWLGMPGKQGGGGGFKGKTEAERNEIIALATLRDAVTMAVAGGQFNVTMVMSIHEKLYANVLKLARGQ